MRNLPETVHEYNIHHLNVWFVVSSILLLGCVIWMLEDDYCREWKPYQRQARVFEIQQLQQERAMREKKMEETGFSSLTNKLVQAEAALYQNAVKVDKIRAALNRVEADLAVEKNIHAAEKALLNQRKSEYNDAVEFKKDKETIERNLGALRKQEAAVTRLDAHIEDLDGERRTIQEQLRGITSEKEGCEKEIRGLTAERDLTEKKLARLNIKNKYLLAHLLDAPLVEFAQPTVKVEQVIAEDQTYSLNFTDVPRIDRCTTCHTFTDKKDTLADGEDGFRFVNLPQPWTSHPRLDIFLDPNSPHPVNRFGCSVCHAGWDRGTTFVHTAHTPSFYSVKTDYVKMPLVEREPHWVPASIVGKWKPGLAAKVQDYMKLTEEKKTLKASRQPDEEKQKEVRTALQTVGTEINEHYGMNQEALGEFQFAALFQEEAWKQPPLHWHPMHHKEDPMRPREFIESSCLKCHRDVTEVPVQRKDSTGSSELNPGEKINAGLRLIEQAGCYACHKMQALETTMKHKVKQKFKDGVEEKITKKITKPNGEMMDKKDFIKPVESLDAIAASWHADPKAIMALNGFCLPEDLEGGRELDIPVRTPHPKPGPSLKKIAAKTSKEWMIKWLENPKAFRPNTFMPQFWNLDNNRNGTFFHGTMPITGDKPRQIDWLDRNTVEMTAITEYLFKVSEKPEYPKPPSGDPSRGEKLVNAVGCMGCHVMDQKLADIGFRDRRYRSQGPMLYGSGSKYDAGWLHAWLKNPEQYRHDTRMPDLRLTDQEAADITAYLMTNHNASFDEHQPTRVMAEILKDTTVEYLKKDKTFKEAMKEVEGMNDEEKLVYLGKKLVQRYGCMNCHQIKDMENAKPISIELSEWASKIPTTLDFGFIEIPHNNYSFLHQKLRAPRSFDRVETQRPQELLVMPQYNFTEEQIELIMTAVMGMTNEKPGAKVKRQLTQNEWYIENGRWLIKELNCVGCHVNEEGQGGAIRRTMDDEKTYLFPPSLDGVGIKVRPDWLHAFLKEPGQHVYRYWLQARMPTYSLTDDQINTLIQYFALRDKQPYPFETDTTEVMAPPSKESVEAGAKIIEKGGCLNCHRTRTLEEALEAGNPATDFSLVKHRMRPKGLAEWLAHPGSVTLGVNMPDFWSEGQPSPLTDILDGDSEKQIRAVMDYLRVYNAPPPAKASK